MAHARMDPHTAAQKAVSAIGQGYNLAYDLRLSSCKAGPGGSRLIELDRARLTRDLVVPGYGGGSGNIVVEGVPNVIKCDKGDVIRFGSDVLSFNQMSEKFNQELGLSGKIPSGMFNAMYDLRGCWQKDASYVKNLAFDGWFISLYNIELERSHIRLSEQVRQEVPTSWDPVALAEFIEKYGTHVVVGVKMGGKDVMHVKQLRNSNLEPPEVQKILKRLADERFSKHSDPAGFARQQQNELLMPWSLHGVYAASMRPPVITSLKNEDVTGVAVRRGGVDIGQGHNEWLSTILESPNVISMSFVPITSLLGGVQGNGFLSHAINLYLRYKPPIEELHQFLEFQLPRQWAPMYGDLPLTHRRRKQASPALRFSLMGPKLFVNTLRVDSGNRPVTGVRLYLEGKRCDHLAIHLQHLSSLPATIQLSDNRSYEPVDEPIARAYLEPVNWTIFSHICTAPVQYNGSHIDDTASIVTKAWFEVKLVGMKKVLFLRLGFSMVASTKIRRSEWDEHSTMSRKSGVFSALISTRFSTGLKQQENPVKVDVNSAIYPGVPPLPAGALKMSSFVETREMVRGPEDPPGYWVVTGAKLCIVGGKISIKVKYSLLALMSEDSMMFM